MTRLGVKPPCLKYLTECEHTLRIHISLQNWRDLIKCQVGNHLNRLLIKPDKTLDHDGSGENRFMGLIERFLIRQHRTKRLIFRGSLLFQATYNNKKNKNKKQMKTNNSTYLVSAESVSCAFPSASLPLPNDTR